MQASNLQHSKNRILYFCDSLFYYSFSNPTQKVKILIIQKIREAFSPVYKSNRCECFPRIVINLIAVVKHKPRGLNVERTSQWFLFKPELAERELWRFWSRGLRFLHIVKMESLNHFYHCNNIFYVKALVFYKQGDTLQLSWIWRSTKATVSQNQTYIPSIKTSQCSKYKRRHRQIHIYNGQCQKKDNYVLSIFHSYQSAYYDYKLIDSTFDLYWYQWWFEFISSMY